MTPPLVISRVIAAERPRVFAAFVDPRELRKWWGPPGIECSYAEVDARVGGRYRIDNRLADGSFVVIQGVFTDFEPPERLAYTWCVSPGGTNEERVEIKFDAVTGGTRVTITHDRIEVPVVRKSHAEGWVGCLDGLTAHFERLV